MRLTGDEFVMLRDQGRLEPTVMFCFLVTREG